MANKHCFLIILMLLIIFNGCKKRPEGVLSETDMIQLIADMEVVEIYVQNHSQSMYDDSVRDRAVQWVLDRRGISKADFDSTMTWYGKNIDIYRDLFVKVDQELAKRQRKSVGEESGVQVNSADDLWPYSRHFMLSELGDADNLVFLFEPEEINKGDRLNLRMNTKGLESGSVLLGVEYKDDTWSYLNHKLIGNSKVDIALQTDTAREIKRIYGYLRPKDSKQLPVWVDSIALERFPLDTTLYYRIFSQRKYAGAKKRVAVVADDTVPGDKNNAKIGKTLEVEGKIGEKYLPKERVKLKDSEIRNLQIEPVRANKAQMMDPTK